MKYIFLDFMRKVRNKNMCQMYLDLCVQKGIATRWPPMCSMRL